jgi:uncharacterized membrane protein YedE/YeeE
MNRFLPFAIGLLFGIGLCVSGMTEPSKVLGFLDIAGPWDPSLAFVMGGGVIVALIAFRIAGKRGSTLLGAPLRLPTSRVIDLPLVLGSLVFGTGWGLAGICPGPGIVDVGFFNVRALVWVVAALAGMGLYEASKWARKPGASVTQDA